MELLLCTAEDYGTTVRCCWLTSNFIYKCEGQFHMRSDTCWPIPSQVRTGLHPRALSRRNLLNQRASASQKCQDIIALEGDPHPTGARSQWMNIHHSDGQLQMAYSLILRFWGLEHLLPTAATLTISPYVNFFSFRIPFFLILHFSLGSPPK